MSTKSSVWDKILKVIIAVASALIGALIRGEKRCVSKFGRSENI